MTSYQVNDAALPMAKRDARPLMFITRALTVGGSERQLVLLAKGLRARGYRVLVACFYDGGPLELELEAAGVAVIHLGKRGRWDLLGFQRRLISVVRRECPRVIHGYLASANIFALLLRPWARDARIVWGVRASAVDLVEDRRTERLIFRLSALLSRRVDLIIANSWEGARYHIAHGYPPKLVEVVPNGIDCRRFRRDHVTRTTVRQAFGIGDNQPLVGMVARLSPIKGYDVFLEALAILRVTHPNVSALCVGDGTTAYREELIGRAQQLGVDDLVHWTGVRSDVAAIYSALDVYCSASRSEGFSNAIAEAMACGTPCVATDVGDSARIVGETGLLVPVDDPAALAAAMSRLIGGRSPETEATCRRRIVDSFGVDSLIQESERLLCAP